MDVRKMAAVVAVWGIGMVCAAAPAIEFRECYVNYDTRNGATELIFYEYTPAEGVELTTNGLATALGLKSFSIKEVMFNQGAPPYKHEVTSVEAFREELEKGLGRKVDLKFDPQKVPVAAPNF